MEQQAGLGSDPGRQEINKVSLLSPPNLLPCRVGGRVRSLESPRQLELAGLEHQRRGSCGRWRGGGKKQVREMAAGSPLESGAEC